LENNDLEREPTVSLPNKRYLDLLDTPPNAKRHHRVLIDTMKETLYQAGYFKLKCANSSEQFPSPVYKCTHPHANYELLSECRDPTNLQAVINPSKKVLEENLFKPVDQKFVESVIITPSIWILLTEVDIFITDRKDLDDCAYHLEPEKTHGLSIKTSTNKYLGAGYKELVMQYGSYQILGLAGIYGNNEHVLGGFLGSSVPCELPEESNVSGYSLRA
jgi:hypothetical protein